MPIDARTAVEVANSHGLSLSDAQALAFLADSEEEARTFAEVYAKNAHDPNALANAVTAQRGY